MQYKETMGVFAKIIQNTKIYRVDKIKRIYVGAKNQRSV
jgi:hypothetical protein